MAFRSVVLFLGLTGAAIGITGGNEISVDPVIEYFKLGKAMFGFVGKGQLWADPISTSENTPTQFLKLKKFLDYDAIRGKDYLPLGADSLPSNITSCLDDTLTLIRSSGRDAVRIEQMGLINLACGVRPVFSLNLLDSLSQYPTFRQTFLLLSHDIKMAMPIVPYIEYKIDAPELCAFADTIANHILARHSQRTSWPMDTIKTFYYGKKSEALPDSLFMTVHGLGGSTECCWHTVYLLTRSGKAWTKTPVIPLECGLFVFTIDCAMDIDGDGVIEYLVFHHAAGAIYRLIDDRFMPVIYSGYRGC